MNHTELDWLNSRHSRIRLLLLVAAAIVAVIGANLFLLAKDRADLLEQTSRSQRDLVDAVAARLQSSLQKADLLTSLLAQDYLRARAEGNDELFRPVLSKVIGTNPDLALAVIADRDGQPLTGSLLQRPPTYSVADRDYFRHHLHNADSGLFVGEHVMSRAGKRQIIPISRRIDDEHGRFVGVVMVGLAADVLQQDLAGYQLGPNSMIGVAHKDGTVLLRSPELGAIGRNIKRDAQFAEHYDRSPSGAFFGVSPVDGKRRHYVYRVVDGYPLVVATAVDEADSLAGWMARMPLKSGYVLLTTVALLLLALYLYRQQQQLGRTLGLNHAILDSTACGIVAVGADGRVLLFNRAAGKILGYRQDEGYQRPPLLMHDARDLRDLLDVPDGEPLPAELAYSRVLAAIAANPRPEWTLRRANGESFPAALSVAQVRDSQQAGVGHVVVIDDLTQAKALERMKIDFVSVVSHELRTPLTAINGAIAILGASMKASATLQQAKLIAMASDGCARLIRLVSDILDLNKLERGQMHLHRESQPLLPLLEAALAQNETYASQHQVRYRLISDTDAAEVDVDRDRLLQVMTNLLSNAAKFSPPGSEVRVRVSTDPADALVTVEDDGAGIPNDFQSHVFERFSQSDAVATRSKGGSGLGLSIAKAFVDAHGGSLSFRSVEGRGTTFFVRLPLAATGGTPR